MEIQKIEDEKLQRLADDPNNIVYRFEDVSVQHQILPLSEVKDNIMELWKEFKEIKGEKTLSYSQVRKIRITLENKNKKWKKFSNSHPLIFDRVVDHRTGEEEIKALLYMIFLRSIQDKGEIANGAEQLQSYIFDKFSMSESDYRAQGGDVKIIDPSRVDVKTPASQNSGQVSI
jgi:catabolite regulation protein CreA